LIYSAAMRFTWKKLHLATIGLLMLIGAGCGRFQGSYSVSPLSLLLPGIARHEPTRQTEPSDPADPTTKTDRPRFAAAR